MKQKIWDIFHPYKAYERKAKEFLATYKKDFSQRTDAEKIVCEAWYKLNMVNSNDTRFLGAIEAVLVLEKYLDPGKPFPKNETYKNIIFKYAEQYLKDRGIL